MGIRWGWHRYMRKLVTGIWYARGRVPLSVCRLGGWRRGAIPSERELGDIDSAALCGAFEPEARAQIMARANEVMAHRFRLLGVVADCSAERNAGQPRKVGLPPQTGYRRIDWHKAFGTGYRWPRTCSRQSAFREYAGHPGADIKWPWELSRCQHLPLLAVASHLAEPTDGSWRRACYEEFRDEIVDWIDSNPAGVGVNWACEMDIAIRVTNWIIAFLLFDEPIDIDEPWQRRLWGSVREHAQFLYGQLRFGCGKRGNHYAIELAGLYIVAALCPFLAGSQRWERLARAGLAAQARKQVRADGVHIEESSAYHLLVTEALLHALLIADAVGRPYSSEFRDIALKMVGVVADMTSCRLFLPQIGDADDGHVTKPLACSSQASRVGHVMTLGHFAEQSDRAVPIRRQLLRLLLASGHTTAPSQTAKTRVVTAYPDAGWLVLRGGPVQVNMCVGPAEPSGCGHAHEDDLSIVVFWSGWRVIVDPGTFCYTASREDRNSFRYRACHNQPEFTEPDPAWRHRPVFCGIERPIVKWELGADQRCITAEARSEGFAARRTVQWDGLAQALRVTDGLEGHGVGRIGLCLAPDVDCRAHPDGGFVLTVADVTLRFASEGVNFAQRNAPYSSEYGSRCMTTWLVWQARCGQMTCRWWLTRG